MCFPLANTKQRDETRDERESRTATWKELNEPVPGAVSPSPVPPAQLTPGSRTSPPAATISGRG